MSPKSVQLAEHDRIMAETEAKIIAEVERSTGITLAETTAAQFDAVKNPSSSLEGQAIWAKKRQQLAKADTLRENAAKMKARYQAWADKGFPSDRVTELFGTGGLMEIK